LVAFACDLGVDKLSPQIESQQDWTWFTRYCTTRRTAIALENRGKIPQDMLDEAVVKIQEIKSTEKINREHESHELFKQEQDEQLINWFSR
jgi:E3 ubiquitin-protein ligase HERC2